MRSGSWIFPFRPDKSRKGLKLRLRSFFPVKQLRDMKEPSKTVQRNDFSELRLEVSNREKLFV